MAPREKLPASAWNEIDPATLPADIKGMFDSYKTQYRVARDSRSAFELAFEAQALKAGSVTADQHIVFGYNFGKLSMAVAAGKREVKAASVAKGPVNAASFLSTSTLIPAAPQSAKGNRAKA